MKKIVLPYESDDFVEFPYQGELTAENLNSYPNQIKDDVLELQSYVEKAQNNLFAFLGVAGSYDSNYNYMQYDMVNNGGNVYISTKDNNKNNALTDGDYWRLYMPSLINNNSGLLNRTEYIAKAGDTEIDGSFDTKYTNVYLNGLKLKKDDEYTIADDGSKITLSNELNSDDNVEIESFSAKSIVDLYRVRKLIAGTVLKSGDYALVDTSEKSLTMTLAVRPTDGSIIRIVDKTGNAQDNPVTVARQGATINGKDEDATLDVNNFSVDFVYDYIKNDWTLST